jgi:hypothetical protein
MCALSRPPNSRNGITRIDVAIMQHATFYIIGTIVTTIPYLCMWIVGVISTVCMVASM